MEKSSTVKKSRVQYENKLGCGCTLTNVWEVYDDTKVAVGKAAERIRSSVQLCATHLASVQAQEA